MTSFEQLGLSDEVLKALADLGFSQPTEIQKQTIPTLLFENRDFIGLANTGTGKTAAFGIPLIERLNTDDPFTQALVLAPTRELGQQIAEQLNLFAQYLGKINILPVYGGAAISGQIQALRKTQQIIIATPGRLIDLIGRKAIRLDKLRFVVLDEADEMLNMGFKEDIDKILAFTPEQKLTWLFSATMPAEIRKMVTKYMSEPLEIKIDKKNQVNANIDHQYIIVKQSDKQEALTRFLDLHQEMRGLIFCRTKRDTQNLADALQRKNYKVDALHGDLSQAQRDRVMKRFKTRDLQILLATDVAARGIDVDDLTHVFHYTLPDDAAYYTHRSGRTARAGKTGISIAFVHSREKEKIKKLQKNLNISFTKIEVPAKDEIAQIRIENLCRQILEKNSGENVHPRLLAKAEELFENLSKEELIAHWMTYELEKLQLDDLGDLNRTFSSSQSGRKEKKRAGYREKRNSEKRRADQKKGNAKDKPVLSGKNGEWHPRFFINLGTRDRMNKHDLMDFICLHAKVKPSDIGHVDLQSSHSFFEVNARVSRKISSNFKNIVLKGGRELRVNRDN